MGLKGRISNSPAENVNGYCPYHPTGVQFPDVVVAPLQCLHGAELVGELGQYEDSDRLCYIRGPEGIIVAPAGELS